MNHLNFKIVFYFIVFLVFVSWFVNAFLTRKMQKTYEKNQMIFLENKNIYDETTKDFDNKNSENWIESAVWNNSYSGTTTISIKAQNEQPESN